MLKFLWRYLQAWRVPTYPSALVDHGDPGRRSDVVQDAPSEAQIGTWLACSSPRIHQHRRRHLRAPARGLQRGLRRSTASTGSWDHEDYVALLGRTAGADRVAAYAAERGEDVDAEAVHATKSQIFQDTLRSTELEPRAGVVETIEAPRAQGLKLGLVTTTSPDNVDALVAALAGPHVDLDDFDVVVDALPGRPAQARRRRLRLRAATARRAGRRLRRDRGQPRRRRVAATRRRRARRRVPQQQHRRPRLRGAARRVDGLDAGRRPHPGRAPERGRRARRRRTATSAT